jgi:hypothetical protein
LGYYVPYPFGRYDFQIYNSNKKEKTMKTKLEIFCAYLPYDVPFVEINDEGRMRGKGIDCRLSMYHIERFGMGEMFLALRPLAAIFTPMQHPATGERIENPAAWIAKKLGAGYSGGAIRTYLEGNDFTGVCHYSRQIDALALELHFDIYGAIEKGFAIEYGAAQ